jgi:uncharacterized membrane protein YdjX (TVP38/TMEM64 family)
MARDKRPGRIAAVVLVLLGVVGLAWLTGLYDYISLENLSRMRDFIAGFGPVAPLVYVLIYAAATVAFLPGTPLTLLGGLAFGPVFGTVWTLIGATLGATLAFLVGRYAARGTVESWTRENEQLRRLDEGVDRHGWRMLMITRLVPLFPFNLQNYAYGLTKIRLVTYALCTALFILPGVIALSFAGGSLTMAAEDVRSTFVYLGIAAVVFVALSLVPRYLRRRSRIVREQAEED